MMRNSKHFALGAATLLLSTAGFTACSSEDTFTGGYSGESVKTQFAISIPAAGKVNNRMGQDIVQGSGQFRGMTNIRLVPFDLAQTPSSKSNPLTGTETMRYNAIALGDIETVETNSKAKLYSDVDIPLGTDAFLFYGEALKDNGDQTDATNGAIVPSFQSTGLPVGAAINTLSFSLKGIVGNSDVTTPQGTLLGILNDLAKVETSAGAKWSEASGDLNSYYENFIKMKAGSANNIRLAVQDLYNAMKSDRVQDENGLKAAIIAEIEKNFTTDDVAEPYELSYKVSNTYPADFNLPDGAVQVKWNSGNSEFEYITNVDYDPSMGNTFNVTALDKYVFPASLYYWLNTNVKTSNTSHKDAFNADNTWSTIVGLYNNGYEVTSSTQSIILENAIDYAVGRLDVYAQFADGEIMDNASSPKAVTIPADGFTLTGVLIGGQKAVNWNFTTNTAADEYTIYDSKVPASTGVKRADATLKNSTLALETQSGEGHKVNFALEFVNNGTEPFTGADGIVPVGGKFYLVGTLTSTSSNNVFKQDCITKANVTINSLKNAYNCIPDLRSPKLELGLSVDLTWENGLSQDVTIE